MALEKAGVILSADNFNDYVGKLQSLNKLQREVFDPNITKAYNDAIKQTNESFKKLPKSVPMPKLPPPDDAKRLQSALELLGQSGKFNISKISDEALRLQEALNLVKRSGQFDIKINTPEIIKSDKLKDLTRQLDQSLSRNPFKALIGDVNDVTAAVGGMLAKFTIVATVLKAAQDLLAFGQASIAVAQRNETLRVSLEEVGTQVGYTTEQVDLAVKLLNKQGITTQAAQQSLMRMARANISWAEASKLAAIAQGSAVVAGMNSSDAFNRLVTGIQKQEPELLDELGITLRREDAYKKFAETVGKSAKSLTQSEKQQAILNSIYEQSNVVLGVYDAAMETTGKQQASLARLVEETQNNLGRMLLPLQAASIEMQTNFWKGAQTASKALTGIGTAMDITIEAGGKLQVALANAVLTMLTLGQIQFDEKKTFAYRLGEAVFNFTKFGLMNIGIFVAGAKAKFEELSSSVIKAFLAMQKASQFDFKGAWDALTQLDTNPISNFQRYFDEFWQDIIKKNPDLAKSWEELNKAIEGTPEDLRLPEMPGPETVEDTTEAIENQVDALEALKQAYKSVQNIQQNYQKAVSSAEEEYNKGLAEAEEKYLKEREQKIAEFNKKLVEFDQESARDRAKMIDDFNFNQNTRLREFNLQRAQAEQDYNLKVKQDKRKFYDDQKKALRDFQLSQLQAQRQQTVTDRRLRADGDVLALMEAREDYQLQQQENKENFNNQQITAKEAYEEQKKTASENFKLQEQQARDSFALQTQIQREEFARRLAEFDENIAIQREKMIAAHQQELIDLDVKYEEEKTKLNEQYQEKLALAQEQRDEQLQALGDSLKEEGKITEEGMKEIADKISEVFGDEQAGDQLIKGWSDRSKDEINNLVDEINGKINELKESMKSASDAVGGGSGSSSFAPGPTYAPTTTAGSAGSGNLPRNTPTPIGARHGFNGVVTGPKTFQVEPGVREHVQMTPVNRFGGSVKLSGSASVNVTGMGQGASSDIENQVATTIVQELRFAIKKLSRRGS